MMMLLILTSVMGYELKTAVGTSVFIMTFTALTGAVSHFIIGRFTEYPGVGAVCDLHTGLGTHCCCGCQQGRTKDPEPGHRRGAGGAGRSDYGIQAVTIIGCSTEQYNRGLRETIRAALCFGR